MSRPDERAPSVPDRASLTAANRVMWNETADVHARLKLDALLESFRDPSFTLLDAIETEALQTVGVAGRDVAQLSCKSSAVIGAPSYWFHHKMSDVIGGALRAGLQIQRFDEHEHDVSTVFRAFQDLDAKPPLSYVLVAHKAA